MPLNVQYSSPTKLPNLALVWGSFLYLFCDNSIVGRGGDLNMIFPHKEKQKMLIELQDLRPEEDFD